MSDRESTQEAALNVSRAIAARELTKLHDDLLAPDFHYHGAAGTELDRDGYVGFMSGLGAAFPDMAMAFEPVVVEGDKVGVHWTNHFTHQGAYMGAAEDAGSPDRAVRVAIGARTNLPPARRRFTLVERPPSRWASRVGACPVAAGPANPWSGALLLSPPT